MDKRIYWIWLVKVFGAANPRLWQLGSRYESAEEYVYNLQSNMVSGLTDAEIDRIKKTSFTQAEEIIRLCNENNIGVYCYESEGYPNQLRKIAEPPAVLFCRGNLDFLNNKITAAVVGTRNPSEYSVKVTKMLCENLCKRGCCVITGIADGIDQLAVETALDSGVPACGVCGREIDGAYPQGGNDIKNKIAENGALISETCSFLNLHAPSFSKRNRILVGLSDAVIFIECSSVSKGLDNATHAISQGKQIFVVPPSDIADSRYSGQTELIRKGCKVIFGAEDFVYYVSSTRIEDFSFDRIGGKYSDVNDSSIFEHNEERSKAKTRKLKKQKPKVQAAEQESENSPADYSALSKLQQDICRLLEKEPMLADRLAVLLDTNITDILTELTMLEMDGFIKSLPGKMFGIQ